MHASYAMPHHCRHMHAHGPRGHGRRGRHGPPYGALKDFLGGRGPRAGRGDVRAGILALLTEEPMHGYQIMRELSERSGGVWRPSPGSIYPTLQQLQDEGLVTSQEQGGGRRLFALTDEGRAVAEQATGEPAPWEAVADQGEAGAVELRDLLGQVAVAARQVVHAGTTDQLAQAKEILREARQRLYRTLAEDDEPRGEGPRGEGPRGEDPQG